MDKDELKKRFAHIPPSTPEVANTHQQVRGVVGATAEFLDNLIADCREKSIFMTKLEEVMHWANKAVANQQIQSHPPAES